MKDKIIEFSNGIFVYDQEKLKLDPQELLLELEPDETVQGSFIISSCDERRIKGILYTRIQGMTLHSDSFFSRATRVEYTYTPHLLRVGESLTDRIWLETNAGEYELPVKIQIKGEQLEEKEISLPELPLADLIELKVHKKGKGRSEEWKKKRKQELTLTQMLKTIELERRQDYTKRAADAELRTLVDFLLEADKESILYPLLDVYVMMREGRRVEAGSILRKYEKSRLYQQKDYLVRAVFLFVNGLFKNDSELIASSVTQLQKIHLKYPRNGIAIAFILELDPKLKEKTRTRYMMLERQFQAGTRNRLLYQEAWRILKEDMALFTKLNAFTLQVFGWAAKHGFLNMEAAQAVAVQAAKLKKWTPLAAQLLKTCYQISPSKETAGAVCAIYIRGQRMDKEAFSWYQKGVELDAKITNLYEYFMYALPEDYPELLPRQVLLYFHYHNTLTSQQKTAFYCNLVRYGKPKDAIFEEHRRLLQEFLLDQLRKRRLNESLAWLYGRCLLVETLEEDLLEALADLLFLRKLTCEEKRIRQVEVCYDQLEEKITLPLLGGYAYIPIYTPNAKIALIDENGKRYKQTVPYNLKKVFIEPKFMQTCILKLKNHLGLNLYLLDGNGTHQLKNENVELVWRLVEDERIKESYRQKLKLELLEYKRKHRKLDKLEASLRIGDVDALSRKGQAIYIETFILLQEDKEAFRLLQKTGCQDVDARLLLRLLQWFLEEESIDKEQLLPYAHQVFEKGMYTEEIVALLVEESRGNTKELLSLWNAGKQFGMSMPNLEEQLLVQALFTEQYINEAFPVFQAMEDRGNEVIVTAYLNYLSWREFVKGEEVPMKLFDSLEHHLLWEDPLSEIAVLCYLKQLSVLLLLTDLQKKLAHSLITELSAKRRQFAFMSKLLPYMEKNGRPDDQVVVEYRCNPDHKVILHYVLEYHGKKTFDYVTECIYPVCGGIFTRAFILFYGERLTWFFTETKEDGTEVSTECQTVENRKEYVLLESRYHHLCRMQQALDHQQEDSLKQMMAEYEELTKIVEEQFGIR